MKAICARLRLTTLGLTVLLVGCNPALYRQPAEDFHAGSTALRDVYFGEWDLSNRAFIERADLEDQVALWQAPVQIPAPEVARISERMSERRQSDVHENLRPLREQAFATLEAYARTLVNLASDVPTDAVTSELTGLASDIRRVVDQAAELKQIGDVAAKAKRFTGPLEQYVAVVNSVIEIVSSVLRERAIVETIGASNEAVLELLSVLKSEAQAARDNALHQIGESRGQLEAFAQAPTFARASNELRADVAKRTAVLSALEAQVREHDVEAAFDAARVAQGALVQKALLRDPGDWAARVRQFREQVEATRAAVDGTRNDL